MAISLVREQTEPQNKSLAVSGRMLSRETRWSLEKLRSTDRDDRLNPEPISGAVAVRLL